MFKCPTLPGKMLNNDQTPQKIKMYIACKTADKRRIFLQQNTSLKYPVFNSKRFEIYVISVTRFVTLK